MIYIIIPGGSRGRLSQDNLYFFVVDGVWRNISELERLKTGKTRVKITNVVHIEMNNHT